MRDRKKPSNKPTNKSKRAIQQSNAADVRRGKSAASRSAASSAVKPPRRDRQGGFFGLLGGSSRRKRRSASGEAHVQTNAAVNRPVDLNERRAASLMPPVAPIAKARTGRSTSLNFRQRGRADRPKSLISLPNPRTKSGRFILNAIRLLIFGVGMGVLAGTMMSIWDPAMVTAKDNTTGQTQVPIEKPGHELLLGQEMTPLKAQLVNLADQNKQMKAGVLLLDLDTNAYVDINASDTFPAASTIKFPVLVAFFQDVDAGKIQLSESLTMKKEQVSLEAGDMQYQPVGTQFTAIETVTNMIVTSDNTATNILIDRLGGMAALNQRFQSWGLSATMLRNLLPDVQGQNVTSPRDLAKLMSQVQSGKIVSMKSRDRLLDMMRRIENNSLLPKGLGAGAAIAHKTGTLGVLLGDIGLIDTPNGKRYLASVLVQRPRDDVKAEEMIQQISKLSYQAFTQPQSAQSFDRPRIAQP
jgi:beta-lactamase class A